MDAHFVDAHLVKINQKYGVWIPSPTDDFVKGLSLRGIDFEQVDGVFINKSNIASHQGFWGERAKSSAWVETDSFIWLSAFKSIKESQKYGSDGKAFFIGNMILVYEELYILKTLKKIKEKYQSNLKAKMARKLKPLNSKANQTNRHKTNVDKKLTFKGVEIPTHK